MFTDHVETLVRQRGDEIREGLASDEVVREYVRAIRDGLKRRDRTCLREYGRVMKLVDAEVKVVHEFLHTFGVRTETELRGIVEAYRSAGDGDVVAAIERLTSALEVMLPMHEEHRVAVVRRLGGYVARRGDAGTVVGG